MEYRKIQKLGVTPSLLGYGCMRFPTIDGEIDEVKSQALLDYAYENGITYFDTAYPYHDGKSEPFVGKAMKKYDRESYYLATKLPVYKVEKTEDVRKIFEEQLEKLQTNYVDFYLLHAIGRERWKQILDMDIIGECEKLQREGKIRFFGFSFHDEYPVFEEMLTYRDWDFCQLQLNYIDQDIQQGMKGYDLATKHNVPVIIMEPIKGNQLAALPEEMTKEFRALDPDASTASWAFRWIGQLPNVAVVLSGMTEMEHLKDNLHTFSPLVPLSEEEEKAIDRVHDIYRKRQKNECTTCGYCMPCPNGVNIPGNFKIWNRGAVYEDLDRAKNEYEKMDPAKRADQCVACGNCEPQCPQRITIIDDLAKVAEELGK